MEPLDKPADSPFCFSNFVWLLGSVAVFYYTDFLSTVRYDHRVHRFWFNSGVILVSINVIVAGFLIVYLSWIKKVKSDDWEKLYPSAIPIATAAAIFGAICLILGLWPVWHLFTPFILFTIFMGFIVVIAMVPPHVKQVCAPDPSMID